MVKQKKTRCPKCKATDKVDKLSDGTILCNNEGCFKMTLRKIKKVKEDTRVNEFLECLGNGKSMVEVENEEEDYCECGNKLKDEEEVCEDCR